MLRFIQPLFPDCPAVAPHISNQGKRLITCEVLKWKHQLLPERWLQVTQKYLRYVSERVASLCWAQHICMGTQCHLICFSSILTKAIAVWCTFTHTHTHSEAESFDVPCLSWCIHCNWHHSVHSLRQVIMLVDILYVEENKGRLSRGSQQNMD